MADFFSLMVLVISYVDALLVIVDDDRWLTSVSCLVSFISSHPPAPAGTGVRQWSARVIVVTCGTICALSGVAAGLAGPWAVPALVDGGVSFCMLSAGLFAGLLFNICIFRLS